MTKLRLCFGERPFNVPVPLCQGNFDLQEGCWEVPTLISIYICRMYLHAMFKGEGTSVLFLYIVSIAFLVVVAKIPH